MKRIWFKLILVILANTFLWQKVGWSECSFLRPLSFAEKPREPEISSPAQAIQKILKTLENYEPLSYPAGQETRARFIGSAVPASYFDVGKGRISARLHFDQKDRVLEIIATDLYDIHPGDLYARVEVLEKGTYRPAYYSRMFLNLSLWELITGKEIIPGHPPDDHEIFQNILIQVANNMETFVENPDLHLTIGQIENFLRPKRLGEVADKDIDRCSEDGFMGEDEHLLELVEADAGILEQAGITHDQIAAKLEYLFDQATRVRDGTFGKLKVTRSHSRGIQKCPWGILDDWHKHEREPEAIRYEQFSWLGGKYDPRAMESINYTITNLEIGQSISVPSMAPHLIGDHHFFEGHHSPYRMDPLLLIRVLDIKPKPLGALLERMRLEQNNSQSISQQI